MWPSRVRVPKTSTSVIVRTSTFLLLCRYNAWKKSGYRYGIRRCLPHTPGMVFLARLLNNQGGANTNDTCSESSNRYCQRRPLASTLYSNRGDIEHVQSAQWCVIYTVVHSRTLPAVLLPLSTRSQRGLHYWCDLVKHSRIIDRIIQV